MGNKWTALQSLCRAQIARTAVRRQSRRHRNFPHGTIVIGALLYTMLGPSALSALAQVPCSVAHATAAISTVHSANGEIDVLTGLVWSNPNRNLATEPHTIMRVVRNKGNRVRDIHWQVGRMRVQQLTSESPAILCVSGVGFPAIVDGALYFGPTRDDRMTASTFVSDREPAGMNMVVGSIAPVDLTTFSGDSVEPLGEPYALTTRFVVPSGTEGFPTVDVVFENSVTLHRYPDGSLEYALIYRIANAGESIDVGADWLPPPATEVLVGRYSRMEDTREITVTSASRPILSLRTVSLSQRAEPDDDVTVWFDVAALLP